MEDIVLSLRNITKTYPGVKALDNVSIDFRKGEVHALLGENGAGKSTLIKVISGAINPDSGEIIVNGQSHSQFSPHLAKLNGIEVIYQEFNLVSSLSAAENISLGERPERLVNYKIMRQKAVDIFEQMKISIDPDALIRDLPSSQQQIVEIAKAVSRKARILIMDEPSAPLSVAEVEKMFDIVRKFRADGVTVIYISHRMDELFEIADRVSVMRDGCYVDTVETSKTTRKELIQMMVGRDLKESYPSHKPHSQDIALEVKNICGKGSDDISFSVYKGEILGVAGLVGAGRTEMARLIYGADKLKSGQVLVNGKPVSIKLPSDAIHSGVGLIPEDRKQQGCFLDMTITWNMTIANITKLLKGIVIDSAKEKKQAETYTQMLGIKTPSIWQKVKNLSGGNQQKVVLAKTLATNSNVIIFDEPTRGIDVGAKQEIYQLMCSLADKGTGMLMITSDMEELLGMSDRIIVLAEGKLAGTLEKAEFSQSRILELAAGYN